MKHTDQSTENMSSKITIHSNKLSFCSEADETILQAAFRQGYNLPYNCRNGLCGACKGQLLDGEIYYQNAISGLSQHEKKQGYILCCQAIPKTDINLEIKEIEQASNLLTRKLPCRVDKCEKLNDDVIRLFLKLPAGERLQFFAGQYIDFLLQDGKRRSFSLANAPHDDEHLELHIRYYQGGVFSEYALHTLQEGALLKFAGPLGTFCLRTDSQRPIIMVAGGTGFAPIKSIIEHAIYANYQRPIHLYWGAREEADLYLHHLAQAWADENAYIHYTPVLSDVKADAGWQGRTGLVHVAVLEDIEDIASHEVYTCGPPPMIKAVRDTCLKRQLSKQHIYTDSFEFAAV